MWKMYVKNPAKRRYVRPVSVFIKILVWVREEGISAKNGFAENMYSLIE